jgi:hypothetical protein
MWTSIKQQSRNVQYMYNQMYCDVQSFQDTMKQDYIYMSIRSKINYQYLYFNKITILYKSREGFCLWIQELS